MVMINQMDLHSLHVFWLCQSDTCRVSTILSGIIVAAEHFQQLQLTVLSIWLAKLIHGGGSTSSRSHDSCELSTSTRLEGIDSVCDWPSSDETWCCAISIYAMSQLCKESPLYFQISLSDCI